ncbi:epoxide hydrolase [Dacryopinax primogenitus]|uniref:Epoxide hydrolase n=1 Tax=Dacryopinax primogenitus (strain DJM 731) TaxID=1858805 RepID=M5FUL7_DACPD|nr:epoxide hydrolase [Dacryopinax primogenitus]EJT99943.1 epoxide hydrolase [Dacryopinax primogenitus]
MSTPVPKRLDPASRLPTSEVERMFSLLRNTRLPEKDIVPGAGETWDYGMPLARLEELKEYWLETWKFDEFLADISRWEHYTVEIEGIDVHYIHVKSGKEGAIPLLMTHGWPGSFYEFHKVMEPLSSPSSPGDPLFDLVVPSLPGYGFSAPPTRKGWTLVDTARVFNSLMVDVLGYKEYAAQGGDWGWVVTRALTAYHSDHCVLAHFNNIVEYPPVYQYPFLVAMQLLPKWAGRSVGGWVMSGSEMDALENHQKFRTIGSGYYDLQRTKPTTIGYALVDHPLGLLAYMGEKYHGWVDRSSALSDADIITTMSLYFITRTFATSVLTYYETPYALFMTQPRQKQGKTAISLFSHDVLGAPRSWVQRVLNVVSYREHEKGGHFAALEVPDIIMTDVREFVKGNWKK